MGKENWLRKGGLPTEYYTGNPRLGDFSVPTWVYNFSAPSPVIPVGVSVLPTTADIQILGGEAKPSSGLSLDLDLARKLFVPSFSLGRG